MREILFRGKDISDGKWIEGGLVQGVSHELWQNAERAYILVFPEFLSRVKLCEVDLNTVGQYTGLTDKNGKKIFEGDIVSIRFEGDAEPPSTPPVWYESAEVFFSDEFLVWGCRFTDGLEMHFAEYNDCDAFVVGNIHDNPELLEVDNG